MNKYKKIIVTLFLFLASLFFPSNQTQASLWPGSESIIKSNLDEMRYMIHGIILGALKQQAAIALNAQIDTLIGGGSGGSARFIVNWQDYLIAQPENQTNKYINAYIDQTLRRSSNYLPAGATTCFGEVCLSQTNSTDGKNYADYSSEGFFSSSAYAAIDPNQTGGFVENYPKKLAEIAKKATSEATEPQFTYEGNPSQMFDQGNFQSMSLFLGPDAVNDPWSFQLNAQRKYDEKLQEEKQIASDKAKAYQGMIGTGEKDGQGQITNPGSIVLGAVVNAQNMGNEILTNATHPGEAIAALVSGMINKAVQRGFDPVQAKVQNEVNKINQVSQEMTARVQNSGPGAIYQ